MRACMPAKKLETFILFPSGIAISDQRRDCGGGGRRRRRRRENNSQGHGGQYLYLHCTDKADD